MITVVQRVLEAKVVVADEVIGHIGHGLLLLVAFARGDTDADVDVSVRKLVALRMFEGKTPMDLTVHDIGGAVLVVSQFTLVGRLYKGNRPSFDAAAAPEAANTLYESMIVQLRSFDLPVQTGRFGADMKVSLTNDGPVTFIVESSQGALVKRELATNT